MKKSSIGFLSLLVTSFLFATYGPWIRIISLELSTYQQLVLRYGFGALLLLLVIKIRKEKLSIKGIPKVQLLLFSLSIPISFIFFNLAILNAKFSVATVGFYLGTILIGFLIGFLFFKEKPSLANVFSLILAIFGLAALLFPFSLANINMGFIWGILSGVAYGVASIFKKHLKSISRFWLVEISAVATVLFNLPIVLLSKTPVPTSLNVKTLLAALAFALTAIVAEFLSVVGFQNINLNLGSIILAGEIVFAGILGFLFYQEILSGPEVIGILLIGLAILSPNLKGLAKSKP